MSREAAAAAAVVLLLASSGPALAAPAVIPAVAAPKSVAHEPLFADIVARAGKLKAQVISYRTAALKTSTGPVPLAGFDQFKSEVAQLSALDMKGHIHLTRSGEDNDLKCILKGMSEDLPVKLKTVADARTGAAEDLALRDMFYLLRDNVEVITTPAKPGSQSGPLPPA